MVYVNSASLLCIIIVLVLSLYRLAMAGGEIQSEAHENSFLVKRERLIVAFLLVIGFAIRVFAFPDGFMQDEAMSSYDAKSLLIHGYDHHGITWPVHMYAWGTSEQSAFLIYYLIPFIKLFGMNEVSVRVAAVILSMIGAVFFWLLLRSALGKEMGIVALIVCLLNPWHFVQSHFALDCNAFPHLFIIGFFLLYLFAKNGKQKYLLLGIIFMGLCQYGYAVSLYCVPVFLVLVAIYFVRNKIVTIKEVLISMGIYLATSGLLFATMILNVLGVQEDIHLGPFTLPAFVENERAGDILFFVDDKLDFFIRNIKYIFGITILQQEYVPWDNVEHFGTAFLCMVPVAVIGFVYTWYKATKRDENSRFFSMVLFWFIMALCEGVVTNSSGLIRRFNIFYYVQIIFIVIGIRCIWNASKRLFAITMAVYLAMGALLVFDFATVYQRSFYVPEASSRYVLDAAYRMKDIECDRYYITPDTAWPGSKDVTEIWVLFAFDLDSDYVLGNTQNSYDRHFDYGYEGQFVYSRADQIDSIDADNAYLYFVNADDKDLFSEDMFDSYQYGAYYLMIPKWMNG